MFCANLKESNTLNGSDYIVKSYSQLFRLMLEIWDLKEEFFSTPLKEAVCI